MILPPRCDIILTTFCVVLLLALTFFTAQCGYLGGLGSALNF